jgi:hypothetical protein
LRTESCREVSAADHKGLKLGFLDRKHDVIYSSTEEMLHVSKLRLPQQENENLL